MPLRRCESLNSSLFCDICAYMPNADYQRHTLQRREASHRRLNSASDKPPHVDSIATVLVSKQLAIPGIPSDLTTLAPLPHLLQASVADWQQDEADRNLRRRKHEKYTPRQRARSHAACVVVNEKLPYKLPYVSVCRDRCTRTLTNTLGLSQEDVLGRGERLLPRAGGFQG
jgi:hypothetical protein